MPLPVLAALLLGGCATEQPKPPDPRVIVKCGTLAQISKEQQQKAAEELDGLSNPSVIAEIIIPDWLRLRDEIRACQTPAA